MDDKAHDTPVPTEIDAKLTKLRQAGIWVSAPTGNHNFSTGISWTKLFARLNVKGRCFFIGRVDNYAYLQDSLRPDDWVEMTTVSSRTGTLFS